MKTVQVNGQTYRIVNSTYGHLDDSTQAAFSRQYAYFGIIDKVNALPPRAKKRMVQLHIFADGSAKIADSRIDGIVAQRMRPLS